MRFCPPYVIKPSVRHILEPPTRPAQFGAHWDFLIFFFSRQRRARRWRRRRRAPHPGHRVLRADIAADDGVRRRPRVSSGSPRSCGQEVPSARLCGLKTPGVPLYWIPPSGSRVYLRLIDPSLKYILGAPIRLANTPLEQRDLREACEASVVDTLGHQKASR